MSQRFQKQLLIKALKNFSEYICRQLKWHQHKIRSRSSISLEITLSLSVSFIPCSTKILTLATAPFLFILIGVFCKFAMVPSVHILLSYQEKRYTILHKGKDVHNQQHIHRKDLNLCLPLYCYGKVTVKLEKTQTRNLTVFMVLVL